MKKVLSLVLALSLVLGSFSMAFANNDAATNAADFLKEQALLVGDENGLDLTANLTREQLMLVIARFKGEAETALNFPAASGFADADKATWKWDNVVAWAKVNGITNGYPDGTFGYGKLVTAQELQAFMLNVLGNTVAWNEVPAKAEEAGLNIDLDGLTGDVTYADLAIMMVNTLDANDHALAKDLAVETPKMVAEKEEAANAIKNEPLVVEKIYANNYKEVVIEFNKELNDETVVIGNFTGDVDTANDTVALNDDKMSVTITLDSAMSAYDSFSVDIADVEDVYENVIEDTTATIDVVIDTEKPVVESVEAIANNKIEVTFSEPVQGTASVTNFYLDGKLFAGTVTIDNRVVTIDLGKRLEAGVYTLTVRGSKIKDFTVPGLYVAETEVEFAVADDSVAPTVSYISGTQTELVFEFSEPVVNYTVAVDGFASADYTKELADDNMSLKLIFDQDGKYIPVNGTTVTFTDIEDGFGNVTEEKVFEILSVDIDIERPEIVEVTVEGQDYILVEFDENVQDTTGTYTLTDADDNDTVLTPAYYVDEDSNEFKNIIKLSGPFTSGDYTLTIEDVEDINPLKNKVIPFTVALTVEDKTAVEVNSIIVDSTNNRMLVEFSEQVDAATALDKANYSYIDTNNLYQALTNDETISLLEDGKTVEIAFSDDEDTADVTDVKVIQIKSVTDMYANVMTTAAYDNTFWTTTLPAVPVITAAKVVDANTIVVDVYGDILAETIAPTDFAITAGTTDISVIDVVYDENDGITLTVNADLGTDGKYEGTALQLDLAAEVSAVDIYGQSLSDTGYDNSVTDGVVPVASEMTTSDNKVFVISLSEDITLDLTNNEYLVLVDGVLINATITWDATNTAINVDLGSVQDADTVVNVKFFPTSGTANVDTAGNALEAFDLSITVE